VLTLGHGNVVLPGFDDFTTQAAAQHLAAHLERSSFFAVKDSPKLPQREAQPRGMAVV